MRDYSDIGGYILRLEREENIIGMRTYLLQRRIIPLISDIDSTTMLQVCTDINYLSNKSSEDIKMIITGNGGDVRLGMAIFDAMCGCGCDVQTICMGWVASMSAFLTAAGTKGKRYAWGPNTDLLLHQPYLSGVSGEAANILRAAEGISKTKTRLVSYLSEFTGKTTTTISSDIESDFHLTAEEAKAYNLIDHIGYPN